VLDNDVVQLGGSDDPALDQALKSDKILPESQKEKDVQYGEKLTLTTYASADCSGQPEATKEILGCKGSPELTQCPKDSWNDAFTCKKTEKPKDTVFSQKFSWSVYDQQFVLRYHTDGEPWKATEVGKQVGPAGEETCFTGESDIKMVMLLHQLNAPSCKPVDQFGGSEKGPKDGSGAAYLKTSGSFKISGRL